jgi:hypothetical protein
MNLVDAILSENWNIAKDLIEKRLAEIIEQKTQQVKQEIAFEEYGDYDEEYYEELDEANVQKMGRTKLVRIRIRGGKIQRRKKFSAVKGYTIRGGKLTRMSSLERRHRKMAARKSKFKRRAKLSQSLRKRRMSLRKRKAMGIR